MSDNRSSSNGDSDDSLRRDPSIRMTFATSAMIFKKFNLSDPLHRSQPQSQHEERRLSQPDGPDSGRRLKEQEKIFEIKASCGCDIAS